MTKSNNKNNNENLLSQSISDFNRDTRRRTAPKTSVRFVLEKHNRFVLRAIQFFLAIIAISVISRIDSTQLPLFASDPPHAKTHVSYLLAASIVLLLLSAYGVLIYAFPAIFHWKVKTVLVHETITDAILVSLLCIVFIVSLTPGRCLIGEQDCDKYNVGIAFTFFGFFFSLISFLIDMQAIFKLNMNYEESYNL